MSVVITTPAVAGAVAGANAGAASRARDSECKVVISDFTQIENPSVTEMQEFAQCVERIYPEKETLDSEAVAMQAFLVISLISFVIGFLWDRLLGKGRDKSESVFFALEVMCISWFFFLIVGLISFDFF